MPSVAINDSNRLTKLFAKNGAVILTVLMITKELNAPKALIAFTRKKAGTLASTYSIGITKVASPSSSGKGNEYADPSPHHESARR